ALLLNSVLETLSADGKISLKNNIAALQSKGMALSDVQKRMTEKIARKLYDEAFATSNPEQLADELRISTKEVEEYLQILLELERIIRAEKNIYFHKDRVKEAQEKLKQFFNDHDQITVGEFRQIVNTSRKYALPLLNYFDSVGFTVRQQEFRVLNGEF
ncbi:MAG: hypothetical protein GXO74_09100, partial [Calditrichaeota bacterium]|nr:hypothetical protein [Calditrichota bacterium]